LLQGRDLVAGLGAKAELHGKPLLYFRRVC
jgi:hypothetical protein